MIKPVNFEMTKSMNLLVVSLFLISCNTSDKKQVKSERTKETEKLEFYKCDYSNKFDTLLSSGPKDVLSEVWGFNMKDTISFTKTDLESIDLSRIVENSNRHLSKRFPGVNLNFSDLTMEKINNKDTLSFKNCFFIVSFLYDEKGYYQNVPVLADGRIVLSENEK